MLKCCYLENNVTPCDAAATFEIRDTSDPDPYACTTQSCDEHIGKLLGHHPEVESPRDSWTVTLLESSNATEATAIHPLTEDGICTEGCCDRIAGYRPKQTEATFDTAVLMDACAAHHATFFSEARHDEYCQYRKAKAEIERLRFEIRQYEAISSAETVAWVKTRKPVANNA